MDQAVAGERIASVETALTRKIGELSPRFFDDDLKRGDVPDRHHGVEAGLAGALGHQYVGPEISKTPVPFYDRRQPGHSLGVLEIADTPTRDRRLGQL